MAKRVIPEVFEADSGFEPTQIDVGTQGSTQASGYNGPEEPQHVFQAAASQHAEATDDEDEGPPALIADDEDEGPPALIEPTEASVPLRTTVERAEGYRLPAQGDRVLLARTGWHALNQCHLLIAAQTLDPNVFHNLGMDAGVPAQIGPPARPPPRRPVVVGNGGAGPSARKAPPPVYVPLPPVLRKAPPVAK